MQVPRLILFSLAILTGTVTAAPVDDPVPLAQLGGIPQFNDKDDVQAYVEKMEIGIKTLKNQKDVLKEGVDTDKIAGIDAELAQYRSQLSDFEDMALKAPEGSLLYSYQDAIKETIDELMKKGGLNPIEIPEDVGSAEHVIPLEVSEISVHDADVNVDHDETKEFTKLLEDPNLTSDEKGSISSMENLSEDLKSLSSSGGSALEPQLNELASTYKKQLKAFNDLTTASEAAIDKNLAEGNIKQAKNVFDGFDMTLLIGKDIQKTALAQAEAHPSFKTMAEAGEEQFQRMTKARAAMLAKVNNALAELSKASDAAEKPDTAVEKPDNPIAAAGKAEEGAAEDSALKYPGTSVPEKFNAWKKAQQNEILAMFNPPKDGKALQDPVEFYRNLLQKDKQLEDSNPRYIDHTYNTIPEAQLAQDRGTEWRSEVAENDQLQRIFQGVVEHQNADYMNKINGYNTKYGAWNKDTKAFANEADIVKSGDAAEIEEMQEAKDFMNTGKDDFLNKLYDIMDLNQYADWLQWLIKKWRNIFGITGPSKAVIALRQKAVDQYNAREQKKAEVAREKGVEEDKKIQAKKADAANKEKEPPQGDSAPASSEDVGVKGQGQPDVADPVVKQPPQAASGSDSNIDSLLGGPPPQQPAAAADSSVTDLINAPIDQSVVQQFKLNKEADALQSVTADDTVHQLLGQLSKYAPSLPDGAQPAPLTEDQKNSVQQILDQLKSVSEGGHSTVDIGKGIAVAIGTQGVNSEIANLAEKAFPDSQKGIQAILGREVGTGFTSDEKDIWDKLTAAAQDFHL